MIAHVNVVSALISEAINTLQQDFRWILSI